MLVGCMISVSVLVSSRDKWTPSSISTSQMRAAPYEISCPTRKLALCCMHFIHGNEDSSLGAFCNRLPGTVDTSRTSACSNSYIAARDISWGRPLCRRMNSIGPELHSDSFSASLASESSDQLRLANLFTCCDCFVKKSCRMIPKSFSAEDISKNFERRKGKNWDHVRLEEKSEFVRFAVEIIVYTPERQKMSIYFEWCTPIITLAS
mmetsp:Transcript_20900/g.30090  ORF Transcript_20900/g.30090 Transcript_20900/m.30090 type:complete len:207 (+) Transcript_20900:1211-1831(+)